MNGDTRPTGRGPSRAVEVGEGGGLRALVRALIRPELLRTRKACGYSWKVPRYYAKMRPKGPPVGHLFGQVR